MEGDMVDDGTDDDAINNTNELENLKDSVRQLSAEVAQLQTELSSAKLLEFETTEQNVNMTQVCTYLSSFLPYRKLKKIKLFESNNMSLKIRLKAVKMDVSKFITKSNHF